MVEELQKIQSQTGFDFMGRQKTRSRREMQQWQADFDRYYKQAHSKALESEYKFIVQKILEVTNYQVKISIYQAASIDPTRRIRPEGEETEGARYMLIDSIAMKEHHRFPAWRRRADDIVQLGKGTQRKLNYYRPNITLENLVGHIKDIKIN